MREEIFFIVKNLKPEYEIGETTDFVESGYLDSFDIISLVDELERKFKVKIGGLKIVPDNFRTIESIEKLILESR